MGLPTLNSVAFKGKTEDISDYIIILHMSLACSTGQLYMDAF